MRQLPLIVTLIACVVVSGCNRKGVIDATRFNAADWEREIKDPALSEEDFTQLYALRVAAEFKGAEVKIVGPRELSVKLPDGTELKSFLDNAWAEAKEDAGNRPEIIKRYLTSLEKTRGSLGKESPPPDTNRIVPVIRDLRYAAQFNKLGQTGTNQVVSEAYVADLLVMYVEDKDGGLQFLTEGDRRALNLALPDLRKLAMANQKRLIPEISRQESPPVFMLVAGGNYESSLLLVDSLWEREGKSVEGDIVAAVPSRDMLIFTSSKSPDGIQKIRRVIAQIEKDGSHLITSTLLVRRNGRWEKFAD